MSEALETIGLYLLFALLAAVFGTLGWMDPWHGIASYGLYMGCLAYTKARRASAQHEGHGETGERT